MSQIVFTPAGVNASEESHHAEEQRQRLVVDPLHHRHQTGPLPERSVEDKSHCHNVQTLKKCSTSSNIHKLLQIVAIVFKGKNIYIMNK